MKITGEQLFFLIQVLKDSLEIQMGYDWSFHHKRDERKKFYNKFIQSILLQHDIHVEGFDLKKAQNMK